MIGFKKKAFTLAELLIVLGIIEITAALTMPALIANNRERVTVTRLKKANSVLNNAYALAKAENGELSYWEGMVFSGSSTNSYINTPIFANNLIPYLNITQNCKTANLGECFTKGSINTLQGTTSAFIAAGHLYLCYYTMKLADGISIAFQIHGTPDGSVYVDIDGPNRGPFTLGKDVFFFVINADIIMPYPYPTDRVGLLSSSLCGKNGTYSHNGLHCAGWIIQNDNMDYLHCNDLNWDRKTKCK